MLWRTPISTRTDTRFPYTSRFRSLGAWWRGWMFDESGRARWLWQGWRLLSPAGFIALLAGWYVVEIGRQPYVVYGLLRTSEAVSPNIIADRKSTRLNSSH